jgi:serpin B
MRIGVRVAAGVAAVALLAAGCGSASARRGTSGGGESLVGGHEVIGTAAREPVADPRPYAAADTAFGLDVLGAWCRQDPRANLVLSPESLAVVC